MRAADLLEEGWCCSAQWCFSICRVMSAGRSTRELNRIARRQAGVFSRRQYLEAGVTDGQARGHVTRGDWRRVGTGGVYLMASHPWGWHQQCHAALLANPRGVLAGPSAVRAYGLPDPPRTGRPMLVVPPDGFRSRALAEVRRSSLIRPRTVEGYRVNALPYALREVAADAPAAVGPLYESAVLRRQVRFDQVADVAVQASAGRLRGARVLRDLLGQVGPTRQPPRSVLERYLDRALDHPSIPTAQREAPAPWAPPRELVDALIEAWGMIVEAEVCRSHEQQTSWKGARPVACCPAACCPAVCCTPHAARTGGGGPVTSRRPVRPGRRRPP